MEKKFEVGMVLDFFIPNFDKEVSALLNFLPCNDWRKHGIQRLLDILSDLVSAVACFSSGLCERTRR